MNVAFSLTPALPQLLFSSGLESGKMILDDAPPVDLQEGSFSKNDIWLGDHHVRVMDARGEVLSFSFHAEAKHAVKLTSPLVTRGGSGIVVSSLGGAAQIYTSAGLKGSLSGQPPVAIPPDGLAVPFASPPQHASVTEGTKVRDISPDPSPTPILTVTLSGGVEHVGVTITANVPDGTVSIDGVELKRKMADGSRFVSLVPGAFNIMVSHDGYQEAAAQKLVIKPGDQAKHMEFTLTPITRMAAVELAGAPAEASVFLDDGVRAGTINAAGGFTKELSPGLHILIVRKAGMEDFKVSHEYKAGETIRVPVQMRAVSASVALHVTPANAKIVIRHDSEIYTPLNGTSAALPAGNYVLTATAEEYIPKSENIQVEVGKPLPIDWVLERVPPPQLGGPPFANAKSWTLQNGWISHAGTGISVYTGPLGTHTVDIQKHKTKMGFGVKKTVFLADFTGEGNYTQYTLDGHNLTRVIFTDGKRGEPVKLEFGQDNADSIRMTVELSPNSFVVKNRAGAVVDTIKKSSVGRFAFVDDVTVHISQ